MTGVVNEALQNTIAPTNRPLTLYLDTNIISYGSQGDLEPLRAASLGDGLVFVVSDHSLDEIYAGDPKEKIEFLKNVGAKAVFRSDAISPNGGFNLRELSDYDGSENCTAPIEEFLIELFRQIAGSPSETVLSDLFEQSMSDQIGLLDEFVQNAKDDGVRTYFQSKIRRLNAQIQSSPVIPAIRVTNEERRSMRAHADYLSQIRPPNVVAKILEKVGKPVREAASEFFRPIEDVTKARERISIAGIMLVALGFCKDKRIGNPVESESKRGARSQFVDFGHIATAAGCSAFITGDKDCARLAFSLYEHFQVNSFVMFLEQTRQEKEFYKVGIDFWP